MMSQKIYIVDVFLHIFIEYVENDLQYKYHQLLQIVYIYLHDYYKVKNPHEVGTETAQIHICTKSV